MYLFDSDIYSNLVGQNRQNPALQQRVSREPVENLYLSVVLVEEYLAKLLPAINRHYDSDKVVQAYTALNTFLEDISRFDILPFDEAAYQQYLDIPVKIRQAHRRDCRVASIAAARGYIVVTRNTRDFAKIGIARYEDWMQEEPDSKDAG